MCTYVLFLRSLFHFRNEFRLLLSILDNKMINYSLNKINVIKHYLPEFFYYTFPNQIAQALFPYILNSYLKFF